MKNVMVGIVLGSISDEPMAAKATGVLDTLGISYEVTVASAHRTPDDVEAYARNAEKRGLSVIVAVAGMSAALPGVMAAHTTLPVVGLPVSAGALRGIDALYSMTQMPPGIPVASVGVDGGSNAALLAARMVALTDPDVRSRLDTFQKKQAEKVRQSRSDLKSPSAPQEAFAQE
ncbi:MAG: 5-(carboxyamino)imidazole ribonucleotide mutase [Dethiosulfovibrio peptidovorans]|nr:MAG: 5-(carboxyamino)imidazole ribonucleotide mutase [Dethiosulfovibrio peptidovorans]